MKARTSCDACHQRKTRCDLGERTTLATSSTNEQISCSFCSSLGVPCRVTKRVRREAVAAESSTSSNGKAGKHKKGKIIREILADAAQESNLNDGSDISHAGRGDEVENHLSPLERYEPAFSTNIDPLILDTNPTAASSSQSRSSFLGVPGLTVKALEDCFGGYFRSLNLWMQLTQGQEVFMKRYSLFLKDVQGVERDITIEEHDASLTPLSELIVLAVASRGAAFTVSNRHLERPLYDRATAIAQQPDYQGLEDLDGIEAITLLTDRYPRSWRSTTGGGQYPSCLILNPVGKGIAAEICLSTRLNEEAPLYSRDYHRRARIFWTTFALDALRSAAACRMYRLHDEDVGWPFRLHLENQPIIAVALIARKLCRTMFSSRARCLGIEASDIDSILDDLANWPDTVKIPVDSAELTDYSITPSYIPRQSPQAASNSTGSNDSEAQAQQHQLQVKRCTAMGFWLRLTLSIWTYLNEIGYLASSDIMIRVEQETARASIRMVKLAKVCTEAQIVDYAPVALLMTAAAWVLYFIRKISDLRGAENQSAATSRRNELMEMARVLLNAVRSAKTRPESEALALRLEAMLYKANSFPDQNTTGASADQRMTSSIKRGTKRTSAEELDILPTLHQSINSTEAALESTSNAAINRRIIDGSINGIQRQSSGNVSQPAETSYLSGLTPYIEASESASTLLQKSNTNATQSLASGFPTGIGVGGDEDYLTLMASCGFDMPFTSLQGFDHW
jgi:hypothetical protein